VTDRLHAPRWRSFLFHIRHQCLSHPTQLHHLANRQRLLACVERSQCGPSVRAAFGFAAARCSKLPASLALRDRLKKTECALSLGSVEKLDQNQKSKGTSFDKSDGWNVLGRKPNRGYQ
jgi:hypothetical protein